MGAVYGWILSFIWLHGNKLCYALLGMGCYIMLSHSSGLNRGPKTYYIIALEIFRCSTYTSSLVDKRRSPRCLGSVINLERDFVEGNEFHICGCSAGFVILWKK